MKKLYVPICAVAFLGLVSVIKKVPLSEEHVFRILNKSVRMLVDLHKVGGGTGFLFLRDDGKVVIVSNAHVCRNARSMKAIDYEFSETIWKVVKKDEEADLCLLYNKDEQHKIYSALTLAYNYKSYDPVFTTGYALLRGQNPQKGYVIHKESAQIPMPGKCKGPGKDLNFFGRSVCIVTREIVTTSFIAYPGNSGSPVVNKWGNIVGVVVVSDDFTHYAGVVPLEKIKGFVNGEISIR